MFMFAIEHTLTAGVGGMVLFASEVCPFLILPPLKIYLLELVRDIDGERHEHDPQISPFDV